MHSKKKIALWALVFAALYQFLSTWIREGRNPIELFSRWEWTLNFFLFLIPAFLVVFVVFLGIDLLVEKSRSRSTSENQPPKD